MGERWTAHRIALIYAAFSVVWIVLSDRVVALLVPDLAKMLRFQTVKGLLFVCASATLVFLLIRSAERRLQREETSLQLLFAKMFDGFSLHEVIFDEAGRPVDHRFLAVNPTYEKLTGVPANRLIGKTLREVLPGSEETWIQDLARVAVTGEAVQLQIYHGELGRWFEVSAYCPAPGQFAAVSRDITAQRLSEQARRIQEERLRLALAGAELGMWDWQAQTRTFTYDGHWAAIVGHDSDTIPATLSGWDQLIHPIDRPRVIAVRDAHLRGDTPSYEAEFRMRHADGHWVWVLSRGKVTERDADGRPLRACGTHLDISDRKLADEERVRLETQLQQAQKMEAIGQLAGGVAHDFNNLLQVINGYSELALADLAADHAARGPVGEIAKAGNRAADLVSKLLAFSRRQVMSPEDVELNTIISALLPVLDRVLGEKVEVHFAPADQVPAIAADRTMVEQVLMNLCVNARDAMPEGGTLTIETRAVSLDQDFADRNAWATPGDYVQLSVTDSGAGMDPGTLERAFEPFFSTKPPGAGIGLGLATVYGIVKQHRGIVRAYSEPGRGSVFHVYFPVAARRLEAVADGPSGQVAGGSETILLAEDDVGVRELAQQILEKAGYRVLAAANGREAVSLYARYAASVDLLLLDVVMPELGGLEAFELIRRICPEVPTVLSSGYNEDVLYPDLATVKGLSLLQKPYGRAELLRAIRQAIEHGGPAPRRVDQA
jgi:two-component system, cell cycle sensor histidine kinase and response regulator CckA